MDDGRAKESNSQRMDIVIIASTASSHPLLWSRLKSRAMKNLLCKIVLLIFLIEHSAQARGELQLGAGLGLQYGGIIGIQGSYQVDKTKLKLALGVIGLSGGIEQLLTERVSIGYQAFAVGFSSGWGVYGNYYFPKEDGNSWVVGLDFIRNAQSTFITATSESENKFLISAGYNF